MAVDKSELRTELARVPSRHAAADSEGLGFVRSGEHNPTTDGDGLAAQRRIEQLLDRGIEGIQVCMEDGGCRFHPDRSPVTFRGGSGENIMRTYLGDYQVARGARLLATARRALVKRARVRFVCPTFQGNSDRTGALRDLECTWSIRSGPRITGR